MRFTGKLKEPIIDFVTHRLTILFEPNEDFLEAYEELKGKEVLSLEIKPYRKKRSLDANAYYWVLLTKLAKVMNTSNAEMHNLMLIHYGEPEIIEGKPVYMTVPDTEDAEKKVMQATEYHLMPTSQVRQHVCDRRICRTVWSRQNTQHEYSSSCDRQMEIITAWCTVRLQIQHMYSSYYEL